MNANQASTPKRAMRVLQALYAKRAPAAILRRAERLVHRLSNAAFEARGAA